MQSAVEGDLQRPWLPWLAFAAISFIWGSTWLAHKWVLDVLTPMGLLCVRMSLAAALCLLIGRLRNESFPKRAELPMLSATGLVLTGLANLLTAWTLTVIPSGIGAILQAPIPVWMALLSMRKEPLSKAAWIATFIGIAGVALVSWPGDEDLRHAQVSMGKLVFAYWLCAATAFVWSWASLIQKDRVHSGGLFTNSGLQMVQGAMLSWIAIACGAAFFTPGHTHITHEAWLAIWYLVILGSCVAFAAYLYLTKVWHPARAGSFAYLNPVIAVALGWWLNNEPLTPRILVGLSIILISVACLQFWARKVRSIE